MTRHLGYPIPSPAIMEKIGTGFRRYGRRGSRRPSTFRWSGSGKGERKIEVMRPHSRCSGGRAGAGVAAIGIAQEYQNVFAATQPRTGTRAVVLLHQGGPAVTCFYFYLWDETSGRGSSRSVPTSRIRSRSGSTATSGPNVRLSMPGSISPSCPTGSPPATTRRACRPSVTVSARPHRGVLRPLDEHPPAAVDRGRPRAAATGGSCRCARSRVSRTLVFDAPRHARAFFEALVSRQPRHRPARHTSS